MKAILVIDVPTESLENIFASAVICEQREGYNVVIKRLVKMSLKPMPQFMEEAVPYQVNETEVDCYQDPYATGWNDCLKEITDESNISD